MQRYEFKVVPAPRRGEKARGVKTTEDRFAVTLTQVLNDMGRDGWEYLRADALPCDERVGLTGSKTTFQNVLVFRRGLDGEAAQTPVQMAAQMVQQIAAEPLPGAPRVGSAEAPSGPAPALGPANGGPSAG